MQILQFIYGPGSLVLCLDITSTYGFFLNSSYSNALIKTSLCFSLINSIVGLVAPRKLAATWGNNPEALNYDQIVITRNIGCNLLAYVVMTGSLLINTDKYRALGITILPIIAHCIYLMLLPKGVYARPTKSSGVLLILTWIMFHIANFLKSTFTEE